MDVSGGSIYVGLGGIALTYLRIAQQVLLGCEARGPGRRQGQVLAPQTGASQNHHHHHHHHSHHDHHPVNTPHNTNTPHQGRRGFRYAHGRYLRKHAPDYALDLAEQFAGDAEALLPTARRVTFLEGYSGALALQAVVLSMRGDDESSRAKVRVGGAVVVLL